ncbi:hypothetical protein [Tabrizicola sp.]|uniref:hypothetical protein n=1 Tax=Tabrizicola sp. TaxID=2005166 RepID=UPI00286C62A5|nr:hypothetical protein [Tabrizicola sp.]
MTSFATFQLRGAGAIALAYAVFVVVMTDGLSLGQHSAVKLAALVVGLVIAVGITFALLWARQMYQDGRRTVADEREEQIEAVAERVGYRVLDSAAFLLVLLALTDAAWNWLGSFALTRTEGLIFALVTVSASAATSRFLAGYIAARRR